MQGAGDSPPVFLSMDVEAVATGPGHNDREPCWVAVVNERGDELLNLKIKVENCFSALTSITGVTKEELDEAGLPFSEVQRQVKDCMGPNVVLVGQRVQGDIDWMQVTLIYDVNASFGSNFKANLIQFSIP